MNLSELNLELNKCKKQRESIVKHITRRNELIEYFAHRKQVHLKILKRFLVHSGISTIISLAFLHINPTLAFSILGLALGQISIGCYKAYICQKFDKIIKKLTDNNKKFSKLVNEMIVNEINIGTQINNFKVQQNQLNQTKYKNINNTYESSDEISV